MNQFQPKGSRRWYRVVQVNPTYRLVEIRTVSKQTAEEIADSIAPDQFIYSDDDGWQTDSIENIDSDDLMNPLQ